MPKNQKAVLPLSPSPGQEKFCNQIFHNPGESTISSTTANLKPYFKPLTFITSLKVSIVFFNNFFCIFQSLIDTKRSTANFFGNIRKIRPGIRNFVSLLVFAESGKHGRALLPKTRS
jgi:hypothetical protein